ncbi:MAG: hypothetical protein E6Q78_11485 [Rhodoferax sp.]|nr:MAG: hypothetical protein E6Q78_11485 [Rhodoferax sp.]
MSARKSYTSVTVKLTDGDLCDVKRYVDNLIRRHENNEERIDEIIVINGIGYKREEIYGVKILLDEILDNDGDFIESDALKIVEYVAPSDFEKFIGEDLYVKKNVAELKIRFIELQLILDFLDQVRLLSEIEESKYSLCEVNDFTLPDNLENGTDAEKELWESYNRRNRK